MFLFDVLAGGALATYGITKKKGKKPSANDNPKEPDIPVKEPTVNQATTPDINNKLDTLDSNHKADAKTPSINKSDSAIDVASSSDSLINVPVAQSINKGDLVTSDNDNN